MNDGAPGKGASASARQRLALASVIEVRALVSWLRAYCSRMRTYSSRVSASFLARSSFDNRPETTPTARLASMT